MLKKNIRLFVQLTIITTSLFFVISCEEDFTDINTTIVTNDRFSSGDTVIEIEVTGKDIASVRGDGLNLQGGALGQYLLGVYNNPNFKKIEASIVSQLALPSNLALVDKVYGADTTVVTTIDAVMLRIPYQATSNTTVASNPQFTLDSIIGNKNVPFTLNVFRLSTFLNTLDPDNPARLNSFSSDFIYDVFPEKLNETEDIAFTPNENDTIQVISRKLSTGVEYEKDTIKYINSNPFISVPLKKDKIEDILLSQYGTTDLSSQEAFDNYFRGIKISAEGNDGSLISLNLNNTTNQPMIDIYYTNTVIENGTRVVDTIKKNDVFRLSGVRTSEYKMTPGSAPATNQIPVQGTAGSMALVNLFVEDTDNNGVPDLVETLRGKNWLINDATLTLYIDQGVSTSDEPVPDRLFTFENAQGANNTENPTQLLDYITEGGSRVGGFLNNDDFGNPDRYIFKLTDYISELASNSIDVAGPLGIKLFNPTDLPVSETDVNVRSTNWNPKVVMLLDHQMTNGTRKAQLKISYTKKIEN